MTLLNLLMKFDMQFGKETGANQLEIGVDGDAYYHILDQIRDMQNAMYTQQNFITDPDDGRRFTLLDSIVIRRI